MLGIFFSLQSNIILISSRKSRIIAEPEGLIDHIYIYGINLVLFIASAIQEL